MRTRPFRQSRTQAAAKRRHTAAALALLALVLALILPSHQSVSAAYVVGTDGWGLLDPLPATSDLYDVWVSGSSDVFAVGKGGVVVRYDGASWTTDNCGISKNLNGVWGSSSDNVFAVAATGEIVHYDGTAWSQMTSPAEASHLADVWGSSSDDVFAVGNGGTVIHYNGTAWTVMSIPSGTDHLAGVWGSSSDDVFAVGSGGDIIHYDGSTWEPMDSSTGPSIVLYGVWGSSPTDVFAVGTGSTITHYDGNSDNVWSEMDVGTLSENLYGIWGTSSVDVYAVGDTGALLHYDGNAWSQVESSTGDNLRGIWGSQSFDICAVGFKGAIVHYLEQGPPTIGSVAPNQGIQGTNLIATITGTNFALASEVGFGPGITVNSFVVNYSRDEVTANITIDWDADTSPRQVSVTTPWGTANVTDQFTVLPPPPSVTSISPSQALQGAALEVTVSGLHLSGASEISFGPGITANILSIDGATQLTAALTIDPDVTAGPRSVTITTPGGTTEFQTGFMVLQAPPEIISATPTKGNQGETIDITLTGRYFTAATDVNFGAGVIVESLTVNGPTEIVARVTIDDAASTGPRDISVTNDAGDSTLTAGLEVPPPSISGVNCLSGQQGEELTVVISGTNLTGTSDISFGPGVEVTGFSVESPTRIVASVKVTEAAAEGSREVTVTTPNGTAVLAEAFDVEPAPAPRAAGISVHTWIWLAIIMALVLSRMILYLALRRRTAYDS